MADGLSVGHRMGKDGVEMGPHDLVPSESGLGTWRDTLALVSRASL